jgi:hypothetical protein
MPPTSKYSNHEASATRLKLYGESAGDDIIMAAAKSSSRNSRRTDSPHGGAPSIENTLPVLRHVLASLDQFGSWAVNGLGKAH